MEVDGDTSVALDAAWAELQMACGISAYEPEAGEPGLEAAAKDLHLSAQTVKTLVSTDRVRKALNFLEDELGAHLTSFVSPKFWRAFQTESLLTSVKKLEADLLIPDQYSAKMDVLAAKCGVKCGSYGIGPFLLSQDLD